MSVEDVEMIDIIGVEPESDKVVLTIADHLEWSDEYDHLKMLQAKLNTYVGFIQSGEMTSAYPTALGRKSVIEIVWKCIPTKSAIKFVTEATIALHHLGIELRSDVKKETATVFPSTNEEPSS